MTEQLSPYSAAVEQSAHWARLVGSGPTVQLRRIQRFGCADYLLELSSQICVILNQTSEGTSLFPGSSSRVPAFRLDGLFSPCGGHTSMPDKALAKRQFLGLGSTHLRTDGCLKWF